MSSRRGENIKPVPKLARSLRSQKSSTVRHPSESRPSVDNAIAIAAAKGAGLRYVSDASPGITRRKAGSKGWGYLDAKGKSIRDWDVLTRIRGLVIPPAWTDVWICSSEMGHIQATGRDARGRKQYRYHPKWRETRDSTKYGKMIAFAKALPKIRLRVRRDMSKQGLPREKVLATVVRLLETTLIRVGNDEYATQNHSYGLTTLQDRHVDISNGSIDFHFKGKSGVVHSIGLHDRRLAKIVKQCQDLPGQELLQYLDEKGVVHDITSADVNAYLRDIAGEEFTAKDFRTWAGTVLAARALKEFEKFDSQAAAKKNVVRAVEQVAMKLGNTKAVCRKCYIHPEILNSYLGGTLANQLAGKAEALLKKSPRGLKDVEASVLSLLQSNLRRSA